MKPFTFEFQTFDDEERTVTVGARFVPEEPRTYWEPGCESKIEILYVTRDGEDVEFGEEDYIEEAESNYRMLESWSENC